MSEPTIRVPGWTYQIKSGLALSVAPEQLVPPELDLTKCCVTCHVVTPAIDRQGEIVDPMGGNYENYARNPVVFFDHRLSYELPIAMCREAPGAPLEVYPEDGRVVSKHYFDQKDKTSMQMFRCIENGWLNGLSVGFDPVPGYMKPIGMRPDGKGKAYHYLRWQDLEHSHTPLGVNPETLTIAVQKGKVGGETMLPMIVKSFTELSLPTPAYANGWTPPVQKSVKPPERPEHKEKEVADPLKNAEKEPDKDPDQPKASVKEHEVEKKEDKKYAGEPEFKNMPKYSARAGMDIIQGLHDMHKSISERSADSEHEGMNQAFEHVKAMLKEAKEHVEGAMAEHHPEVKYEAPPDLEPSKDEDVGHKTAEGEEPKGEYVVKSHKYKPMRFQPISGGPKLAVIDEPESDEEKNRLRAEMLKTKYKMETLKRQMAQQA